MNIALTPSPNLQMPHWSLVQYILGSAPATLGVLVGDEVRALPADWPTTAVALLDEWQRQEVRLRALAVDQLRGVPGAKLVAPITFPRKIICAGANYSDHILEMGGTLPAPGSKPFFFLKPPTTTIVGPGGDIRMPAGEGVNLDFEAELGVVIASRVSNVDESDAMRHVAGYVVSNDLSARGLFHRTDPLSQQFSWDWFEHKAFDDSCPIGPGIVPAWLIDNPEDLTINLSVNGQLKQNSSTSHLVAGIADLISAASRVVTLEPGDLILTGTPAGVGMPRNEFLSVGDVISIEIEGVGCLTNRVIA